MRFPKLTDLDAEQKAIYNGAPPTETILVIGPPGTGKTVMAFHRAAYLKELSKKKKDLALNPCVIMYTRVLSKYTASRDSMAQDVESSTMHSWVPGWWRKMFGSAPLPTSPNSRYVYEWTEILKKVAASSGGIGSKAHWGHLIVDEGQDFPPDMYAALSMISALTPVEGVGSKPAVTVFADDNQRLHVGTNSSVKEIETALNLKEGRQYKLRKNYRNSKQIAEFTRHFYVGLSTGIPDLPSRIGKSKPRVVLASTFEVVRNRIATYAKNNPGSDIGVLCMREAVRKKVYNSLSSRLSASGTVVQTYSNKMQDVHPPEKLQFDRGGSVTVLNCASAKGLEFDAVFLVDPFADIGGAGVQQASMQTYVMASRAREYLEVLVTNPPPDLAERLPSSDLYEQIKE